MKNHLFSALSLLCCVLLFATCQSETQPANEATEQEVEVRKPSISFVASGTIKGKPSQVYTLTNGHGVEVEILNYGGIVTSIKAPDKNGVFEEITLGFDTLNKYLGSTPFFGALVGRYGNRIAKGKFSLDGKTYTLVKNNGENHLHGGTTGFDKVVWKAGVTERNGVPCLKLEYTSPDGEEGYPGNLDVEVLYSLNNDNELSITYEAKTDKPTIVNLTNHTYFNLTGTAKRDILGHEIAINANRFVPVDEGLIPTGELLAVEGTPFDFRKPALIGERIDQTDNQQIAFGGGYDHCWVLNRPRDSKELIFAAKVKEPDSGRTLEVYTTEPGVQFYTGNFLNGTLTGIGGVVYEKRFGFCLETEHFPDSPNQPQFPSVVLRPGETYSTQTVYKFGVE